MAMPNTIFLLLRNMTYLPVENCLSVTLDDAANVIEVYDLETFRNLLGAGDIGRAWETSVAIPFVTLGEPEGADDRLNDIDPRFLLKQRTMIFFWDAAGGTGNRIAMVWSDQLIGYSGGPPQFVGSAPIAVA